MAMIERLNLDALLRVTVAGPSVAMLPDGSLGCGTAADAMLNSTTYGEGTGGGLLLVHSHRQVGADFERHARMLSVIAAKPSRHDTKGVLQRISLLIMNNNAGALVRHSSAPDNPIDWLRRYTLPMPLRMLLLTSLNVGFLCGEFQALAAASPITVRFPWVLLLGP